MDLLMCSLVAHRQAGASQFGWQQIHLTVIARWLHGFVIAMAGLVLLALVIFRIAYQSSVEVT